MNEHLDKIIIRVFFTILFCAILFLYKYAHKIIYPSNRQQLLNNFNPTNNPAETLHFFSRILGIGIIYSNFNINLNDGILIGSIDLFVMGIASFVFYLASIYIVESILLFNFEYIDEIQKRKNMSYALICFSQSIALALIIKSILKISGTSLVLFLFLWLFAMVVTGLAVKGFSWSTKLSFSKLLVQKNLAIAVSYLGHMLGAAVIIIACLNHEISSITTYAFLTVLHIIMAFLIFPIFRKGIEFAFKVDIPKEIDSDMKNHDDLLGYGIYEGMIFFTTCFLTSVIIGHIHFGNFYPSFGGN